jgi:hypothetical protein
MYSLSPISMPLLAVQAQLLGSYQTAAMTYNYCQLHCAEEKKAEALVDISKSAEMPADASSSPSASGAPGVQFVDDRLETLLAMQSRSDLKHVRLYMVSSVRGYCLAIPVVACCTIYNTEAWSD